MTSKIYSCSFTGLSCHIIQVEADISNGLSLFSIVGLGDASVQESKERVRSSIKNSGATFPPTRKIINLAPAQIKKQGSLFDLPIAVGVLKASGQLGNIDLSDSIIVGELSLNGEVKAINGALAIAQYAKEQGFKKIYLPSDNAMEASFIDGIEIIPIKSLKTFIDYSNKKIKLTAFKPVREHKKINLNTHYLQSILGQEKAKRALIISAAGGHNILFSGSPGCGKTMLVRALKYMLPDMKKDEKIETTKIFSISGLTNIDRPIIQKRPFREVHHTASKISIIGGGAQNPKPGEISLAHNGVLFFDEISEFSSSVLESLRQPLEDGYITLNRSNFSTKFPCNFIFAATTNPCPCGYRGDKENSCKCTTSQIHKYQKKLSGPILDRFDIVITLERTNMENILNKVADSQYKEILETIKSARNIQNKRFKSLKYIFSNSNMSIKEIRKHCQLDYPSQEILNLASKKQKLSNRGYIKTIKLARTVADIENSQNIKENHIAEALQYRKF